MLRRPRAACLTVLLLCFFLSPFIATWYLTSDLFDTSEYINSSASGDNDVQAPKSNDFPLESQTISLRGRVTSAWRPEPLSGVKITVTGQVETTTDSNGYFEFAGATLVKPTCIPPGTLILTAFAENYRTKMIRLTIEGVSRRPATPARNNPQARCPRIDFSMSPIEVIDDEQGKSAGVIDAADATVGTVIDEDQDGIDDMCEDWLAERYAPILNHGDREKNYPVSVDWWLARTSLSVVHSEGNRERMVSAPLSQQQLINQLLHSRDSVGLSSSETRSRLKEVSFYLENVAPHFREGQKNEPESWITYVHSFGNEFGGITIQYWRCYSWNEATFLGFDFSHGGDWEGIAVHLNAKIQAENVSFLDHSGITYERANVQWEGTHPKVWSEEGDHSSYPNARKLKSSRFIVQETWTSGRVIGWDGSLRGHSGGLINIGEKTHPRSGQIFIQYAGLWGATKRLFLTSGYWGPAFNETAAQCADASEAYGPTLRPGAKSPDCGKIFMKAWCDNMNRQLLDPDYECYAAHEIP